MFIGIRALSCSAGKSQGCPSCNDGMCSDKPGQGCDGCYTDSISHVLQEPYAEVVCGVCTKHNLMVGLVEVYEGLDKTRRMMKAQKLEQEQELGVDCLEWVDSIDSISKAIMKLVSTIYRECDKSVIDVDSPTIDGQPFYEILNETGLTAAKKSYKLRGGL